MYFVFVYINLCIFVSPLESSMIDIITNLCVIPIYEVAYLTR